MAYIGRDTDKISNVEVLDNITFDGSSSYTLQKNSVNFTPSSANTILLSIDGVVQAGNFTVSGSTIDFGTAVAGTSTCDFILHYGTGLITTPADGTVTSAKIGANAVTNAKLNNDIISGATELASEPADTDEFLVSDAGTLKRIDYSLIKGGGITMVDQFALTSNFSLSNGANIITANLARVSNGESPGFIGTGMTESSGVFTFPSTGIYMITFNAYASSSAAALYNTRVIQVTLNNSSYATAASSDGNFYAGTSYGGSSLQYILDVTDTSNVKVKFRIDGQGTNTTLLGNSGTNNTNFTFIRLGDT